MKKKKRLGARGAFQVFYQGKLVFLNDLAASKGISTGALRERWKRAGMPKIIEESLLFPVSKKPANTVKLLPDNINVTVHWIWKEYGLHRSTLIRRIKKGQTVFYRDELSALRTKINNANPVGRTSDYDDPNFLPHITKGDLAHLMTRKTKKRRDVRDPNHEVYERSGFMNGGQCFGVLGEL